MANAELLHKTMEHIKANPDEWTQSQWSCCFAGLTLKLNGAWQEGMYFRVIEDRAGELLGLERGTHPCECGCGQEYSDVALFDSNNTLADLERIVRDLIAKELLSA